MPQLFAPGAPHFQLVSPLAEGADQIAARVALAKGFSLGAMLPFPRAHMSEDFAAGAPRDGFHALLAEAASVLELPGDRAAPLAAYVMAGRATIAHCDLLIAIWDGEPPRGRGGTGEVVEIALLAGHPDPPCADRPRRAGAPAVERARPARLHDARELRSGRDAVQHRRARRGDRCAAAAAADPRERGFILDYYRERERRLHLRLEYPLLARADRRQPPGPRQRSRGAAAPGARTRMAGVSAPPATKAMA